MKKYIIINGTMCAGKSAVGNRVTEKLGRAAFIDGDFVINMHPHIDYKETESMQIDNILHMSKNYSDFNKCDYVVLSWIMGVEKANKIISEISKMNFQIYHFVLTCSKKVLNQRWYEDAVNDWRTDENLNTAIELDTDLLEAFDNRSDCIVIDTSDLSIDMVAANIVTRIRTL